MKLKNSFRCAYEIYKQSLSTQKFALIFSMSLVLSIYGVLAIAFGFDYINGFINIISSGMYLACLFLIVLLNTYNVFNIFEKNQFIIMRYSSKKEYLSELIKSVCFSNFCLVLLNLILIVIGLNLFCENQVCSSVKNYSIPGFIYLIYANMKLIVIVIIVSNVNILLLKILNSKVITILNVLLYIIIAGMPISGGVVISEIWQLPLFIGSYLKYQLYSTFSFEMICFILYISIQSIIITVLYNLVLKSMKAVIR